jgi:hypothetical protein
VIPSSHELLRMGERGGSESVDLLKLRRAFVVKTTVIIKSNAVESARCVKRTLDLLQAPLLDYFIVERRWLRHR